MKRPLLHDLVFGKFIFLFLQTGSDSILEIYLQNQKEETVQADRSCLKSFKRRSLKASTETGTEKGLANSEQTLVKRKVKDAEEQTPAAKRIVKFNSKEKLSSATKKARVDSKKHSCPAIQRERVTAETFDILSSSNLSSRKQTSKCGSVYIVDIYHSLIGARPVESNHKNFNYPEDILPFEGYGLDMHKDLTTIKSKERYEYLRKSKKDNSNSAILTSQTKGSNRNVTLCRDDLSGVDDKAVETSTVRCTLVSKESVEDLQEIFVSGQNEDSCCMEETMKFGENENSALTDKNVRYEESAEICTSENSEEMGLSKSDVDFHGERCSNNNMNNDHDLFLVEDSRSCSEINQNQTSSLCMDIEAEVSNKLFEDKSSDLLQSAIEDEQNYQNEIDSLCCDITVLNHGDSSFEAAIAEARQTAHECDRPYTLNDVGTMCTKTRDQLPATSVCSNKAREKNHSDIFNRSHIFKSSSSSKQVGNKPWNQKLSPSKLSISARQASDLRSYSLSNLVLEAFQVDSTSDFDPKIHKKKVRHLKCMYCPSKFYRRSDLLRHTRRHTGEKPFKCDVCNKTCKTKENLRRHKSTHLGEKFHVCEVCGKAFSRKFDLKRHSVKHSQERPFACDICGNTFTASNDLCKHRKSHTEEKPFKCKTCGLTFVQKGNLKSHMLVHSNCKSFQCDICEKFFSKKSNLKRHRATHSVEAKYTCGICQRAFARSDDLIRHLRVHSGEKPFICMLCGDGFSQQSHLYAHRRRHVLKKKKVTQTAKPQSTKDWKFGIFCQKSNLHGKKLLQSCDLCCKKFTRSYNLNRHRNWHFENSVFSCETCMWVPSVDEQTQDRRKLCIKLKPFVLLHRLSKFCLHADTNVTGKSQTL